MPAFQKSSGWVTGAEGRLKMECTLSMSVFSHIRRLWIGKHSLNGDRIDGCFFVFCFAFILTYSMLSRALIPRQTWRLLVHNDIDVGWMIHTITVLQVSKWLRIPIQSQCWLGRTSAFWSWLLREQMRYRSSQMPSVSSACNFGPKIHHCSFTSSNSIGTLLITYFFMLLSYPIGAYWSYISNTPIKCPWTVFQLYTDIEL